jgi:hypothetical protein
MWMWSCGQAKLLDQIGTHQVVAASSINNHTRASVLDDEESLEQVVALQPLRLLDLRAEHTLNNDVQMARRSFSSMNDTFLNVVSTILLIVFYTRGADVASIFCRQICPLTRAIVLHVANTMTTVTLNA